MSLRRRAGSLAALLLCVALPAAAAPIVRILFIGNSLTYANDLPSLVAHAGKKAGVDVRVKSIVAAGYSLADHLANGSAERELRNGPWDYVVLQQGPSALDTSSAELVDSCRKVAPLIRAAGAVPVLYMVWPGRNRAFDLPRVAASYRRAAEAVGGLLAPAGLVLADAANADPTRPLFEDDGFHPTEEASRIAAGVIWQAIDRHRRR